MKQLKVLMIALICMLTLTSTVTAGDFDWTRNLSIQAQADPAGFKARLETRFKVEDVQVDAVLSNVDDPADAYLMMRLGEISGRPVEQVVEKYKHNKGKGWGALAKSLGIKPGSQGYHALKQGHDLNESNGHSEIYYSSYDHGRHKDQDYFKGKSKG